MLYQISICKSAAFLLKTNNSFNEIKNMHINQMQIEIIKFFSAYSIHIRFTKTLN